MSPLVKRIVRFLAGAAIIFVGIVFMNGLIGMKEAPAVVLPETHAIPVNTEIVKNDIYSPEIPVEGKVEAWHRIDLFAEVNGVLNIGGKEFREGVKYQKGEVILNMDDSEARASLKGARAQFLQLVTSVLSTIKLDFPDKIDAWEEFVRSVDIDSTLPELPSASSDRESFYIVNRGIDASYHAIKSSEERLAKYSLVAPFDGFVANTLVKPGALVRGGQPMGTFVGIGEYEIKSSVASEFIDELKLGDKVEFKSEGQVVAEGTLDRISSNVNPATQSATAYFKINSIGLELRDGMYLAGTLYSAPLDSCYKVPVSLVENNQVYTIENDALVLSEVQVLFKSFESALITGLEDGTVLLSETLSDSYEGLQVNPSNK
jgi:multidrug efflux pump subunit AcrA (membrane-fusion protein)